MTMQAKELIGAQVTGGDGQVVGTVDQVFNDDADGRPVWALVRAGKRNRFVPLDGSRVTGDGLRVPFNAQKIMSGPDIGADRHMSAAQVAELNRYYGLTAPAHDGPPDAAAPGQAGRRGGTGPAQAGQPDAGAPSGDGWLTRTEERVDIGTETVESGRARLHRYVDTEPVERAVRVFHEEYEVERVPITPEEQARGGVIAEREVEIILHEERPVFRKEAVPVERVRLVARRVEEDRTYRDEIRKERIEIEAVDGRRTPQPPGPGEERRKSA